MKRGIFALCVMLGIGTPAFADTDYEERLAIATRTTQMALEDMDIERVITTMYMPLIDQLRGQGRQISDAQIAEIDALYQEEMRAPLLDVMAGQQDIMADLLTLEELQALEQFYATPEGRSVMSKMPSVMERIQPSILEMVQSTMPRIVPRLQSIIGR